MFNAAPIDWGSVIINDTSSNTLLDMFKTFVGDSGDGSNDAQLSRALSFAGDMVETYLDRIIARREITEFYPHHFGVVALHHYPVDMSSGAEVIIDGVKQNDYELYFMSGGSAKLSRQKSPIDVPMDWRDFDNVNVTYTAGYPQIPTDIANAICYTASMILSAEGTGQIPSGQSEMKQLQFYDVGSVSYDTGTTETMESYYQSGIIPWNAAEMIAQYRRHQV